MADNDDGRIEFLDLKEHPLVKDDVGNPRGFGAQAVTIRKYGLSDSNRNAPKNAIVSNIYEPEDEYQNLYIGASRDQGLIQPPYFMRTLERMAQENNSLGPAIEAMVTNCEGTGYDFENTDKDESDSEDDSDDERIGELKDFFNEPWPKISFMSIRELLRRDIETVGNGYLEVLRNPLNQIVFVRHVDAKMMRIVKLDDPVPVEQTVVRGGVMVTTITMTRERRFTQEVNGISLVYFKEFGASRDINKNTGLWVAKGATLAANIRGSEIIHFINLPDAHTPYGIPKWVAQLPSILGSRRAEEYNLAFFENGGIPPVLILLQGGALTKQTKAALEQKTTGGATKLNRVQVVEVEPSTGSWETQALTRVTVERFGDVKSTDSMFEKYDDKCEVRVRRAFRLPAIFVGAAADYNFATAFASYTVAEAQVFKPERKKFDEVINMKLIPALGDQYRNYKLNSKALSISDPTLVLQGLEVAISTNVVNDSDVLKEINRACGTTLKADADLQKIKTNTNLGLNPDGSKPAPPQIPGMPQPGKLPAPNVKSTEAGPAVSKGPGFTKPGGSIAGFKPKATGAKGSSPIKGKGAGIGLKKSAVDLAGLAAASVEAMLKRDMSGLTSCMSELATLDVASQRYVQAATRAHLLKLDPSAKAITGCGQVALVASDRARNDNAVDALFADKSTAWPDDELNGRRGKIMPGDLSSRHVLKGVNETQRVAEDIYEAPIPVAIDPGTSPLPDSMPGADQKIGRKVSPLTGKLAKMAGAFGRGA